MRGEVDKIRQDTIAIEKIDPETINEIDGAEVRPITVDLDGSLFLTVFVSADLLYGIDDSIYDPDADPHSTILWPAASAVAIELPGLISPGDVVLDLGAGTGLTTLMAAYLGADATAYDHDPFALRLIEESARLQGLATGTVEFDLLSDESLPLADLVIASDLLYDFDLAESLARHIIRQVRGGGRAIVADPGRLASADFFDKLSESSIQGETYPVEAPEPYVDGEFASIEIHIFGG